jgi:hypothetical protein
MRILMNVRIPNKEFNTFVADGSAGHKLTQILEEIRPEAVYFTEQHGQRGAVMVADVAGPSDVPRLAEPWFLVFNADVEFHVAMTPADLEKAGLDQLAKHWAPLLPTAVE